MGWRLRPFGQVKRRLAALGVTKTNATETSDYSQGTRLFGDEKGAVAMRVG